MDKTIRFLESKGFKMVERRSDRVFMDSPGEDAYTPVVQARIYANMAGTYSVSLEGGWKAPAVDNEEAFIQYLDENFPGWSKVTPPAPVPTDFDRFYPVSSTMSVVGGMWQLQMTLKLSDHLQKAKSGNRDSESRLCNRLGQLRRNVASFSSLSQDLSAVVKESVEWLRTTGRKVNFTNPNPGLWITTRDGKSPRF